MNLWDKILQHTERRVNPHSFATWFRPTRQERIEEDRLIVRVPTRLFCKRLKQTYGELLQAVLTEIGRPDLRLEFICVEAEPVQANLAVPTAQARLDFDSANNQLNPRYTFDTFIVGASNQFAHAAALAVAEQPSKSYNPLFLYGGVGLGKTHLMQAIGHELKRRNPGVRLTYISAEKFTNEVIASIRFERMAAFRDRFRNMDVLMVDDIQFIARAERTQEEFFHTFNALHAERHQIILTSDKIPREIPGLEERLRNRFEMGLIADIAPPDLETRVAIVQKKAVLENLRLAPEVAMYIAQSVSSNVRELEGCLTRLAALASFDGSAITVEFAKNALQDLVRNSDAKPDIDSIQKTVSDFFHIRLTDLKSKKRTQHIAFCRQVAMYLCRKLTDSSFPTIGEHFGRDHSTVIHAYNLIMRRVTSDSAFRLSIEKIERELKSIRANAA